MPKCGGARPPTTTSASTSTLAFATAMRSQMSGVSMVTRPERLRTPRRLPMTTPIPRYAGPKALAESLSAFARAGAPDARWNREGLRDDSEYRDLGLAAATGGRIGAKHIRALKPMPAPTGWHWHDMTAHYVYVLHGSLTFRFGGVEGDVT